MVRPYGRVSLAIGTGLLVSPPTEIGRADLCQMGDEREAPLGYGRTMRSAINLAKRAQLVVQRHPLGADTVLAVVLAIAAFVSLFATYGAIPATDTAYSHGWTVPVVISLLAVTLPLAWRRRFPFSVAFVVLVAFLMARIVVHVPEASITLFALWLMLYSVAVHGHRRFRLPALALCYVVIVAELVRELFFAGTNSASPLVRSYDLVYNAVVVALPCLLGAAIWSLRDRQRKLTYQAVELRIEREENARQEVFAERVRIARELHDVVAHHVSVIGVQAAGARMVMDRQPARAAEALSSIEDSSRRAVVELHRLLGFLRRADETDGLLPQPCLAQIGDLIAEAQQAQLTVDLTINGTVRPLPPTLEVSAYRVIQEALTNTRKHSSANTASIRLHYGTAELDVEVLDDGPGRDAERVGGPGGLGLIGMRERAALHGGELRAGPRPGGGFAVHAAFPIDRDAA